MSALIALGALFFVIFGSCWSVRSIDQWSRDDYQRGLKDGRYHGDIGIGRGVVFVSIDRMEATRIAHGRTHEASASDRFAWFAPTPALTAEEKI